MTHRFAGLLSRWLCGDLLRPDGFGGGCRRFGVPGHFHGRRGVLRERRSGCRDRISIQQARCRGLGPGSIAVGRDRPLRDHGLIGWRQGGDMPRTASRFCQGRGRFVHRRHTWRACPTLVGACRRWPRRSEWMRLGRERGLQMVRTPRLCRSFLRWRIERLDQADGPTKRFR